MARKSFKDLKATIGKSDKSDFNYGDIYPFWNMPDGGEAIIRFLPDLNEDNPEQFMLKKLQHKLYINGKTETFTCPKTFDKKNECAACATSAEFYDAEDKTNGKKFYRDQVHLARAVIVSDALPADDEGNTHEGKIMTINLSFQVYNAVLSSFNDLEDYPFDYDNGCNFIITKKIVKDGNDSYANYSFSKFARKETKVSEYIKEADMKIVDLKTLIGDAPTVESIETMVDAALRGSDNDASAPKKVDSISNLKNKLEQTTSGANDDDSTGSESDISDAAEDILNDIMAQNAG